MGAITRTFANQIKTGGKLDADGLDLTDTFAFTGTVTGTGGITEADMFRLTAVTNQNTDADITTNIERVDDATFSKIGTGMTESSGVFTFPSTGLYLIIVQLAIYSSDDGGAFVEGEVSSDSGSSYDTTIRVEFANGSGSAGKSTNIGQTFVNVTNSSNFRVKFKTISFNTTTSINGDTDKNISTFAFIKLGDSQ